MSDFTLQSTPRNGGVRYHGVREGRAALVYRDGVPFDPRPSMAVRCHSPTGFEWGYFGSGPAQLSLALLLDQCEQIDAVEFYQPFHHHCIALLEGWAEWRMTGFDVHERLCRIIDDLLFDAADRRSLAPRRAV